MPTQVVDLLIIGGGINGAGIARDAAGRGLSVMLVEKDDLAAATSSASSKLIHGGLRYLEQYEFRLVAEALSEREVLLNIAPHLVQPLMFVMPHVPELRPRWMIRAGLYLYDHLGRRTKLPASHAVKLQHSSYGDGLRESFTNGFTYSDCRVDDARLVIANAIAARESGADIRTRTELTAARRHAQGWRASLRTADGTRYEIDARALVNAAGPWVKEVLNERLDHPSADKIKLVKGSHIIVARRYQGDHAYILQNDDRRIVFMIPYLDRFTLIGTTDVSVADMAPEPSDQETEYLCRAVNRYLDDPIKPADVMFKYAGVRPLYDDGSTNPSAVTRDYTLRLDDDTAPVLSVFGGKITTYRKLAEHALDKLRDRFPAMRPAWTAATKLPGADFASSIENFSGVALADRYPWMPARLRCALAHRHGTRINSIIGDAKSVVDLGTDFGGELSQREIDYLIDIEWAQTGADVLYRRTKAGLLLQPAQREAVEQYVATRVMERKAVVR